MASSTQTTGTLEQRRAKHAWQAVQNAIHQQGPHSKQDKKKFGVHVKKLPVRIMASGLGQSLAFLHAKDYAPGLIAELNSWIQERFPDPKQPEDLLERLMAGDAVFLRRVTKETLAYLYWLVRFAEAHKLTDSESQAEA